MLSFEYNRTSNVSVDVNVGVKNHNFKFPLILDINVNCLHSSLQAKLLMHNCARAKNEKHVFVAYKVIWKLSLVENKCV